MDRGYVVADDHCRTSVEGVYAVGDIVPGLQLAHRGFAQGILVAETIAGNNPPVIDEKGIPRVTYCEPEIASIGLTEAQAREEHGDSVACYEYNLGGNGKSQILGTSGVIKVVRVVEGPVVGVHMIGARMGEQIGEAQLIYNWEAMPEEVAQFIHAHPTQNEALGEAHMALSALGESVTEGTVTRWLKQVGDTIAVDEPLVEVSTDKVDTEIPSPVAGTIVKILVAEDETAEVGAVLVEIGSGDEASSDGNESNAEPAAEQAPEAKPQQQSAPAQPSTEQSAPAEAPSAKPEAQDDQSASQGTSGGEQITMPALGESVTEGTVTRWLKKEGDSVEHPRARG
ncbi:2-oxoisovalerate dehydrogenase [Platysternon megacephalum]|uniref:dihydrolipoyl dehydrogenase n=1 Tax=Platysternon megacephalum TaxID=55544 RepID=A0A4D9DFX1_9SAUR|nr:2-oxoisovalerate dehydrogenase [Platysternon megacephalum]